MKIFYINDALAIWGGIERILVDKVNYLTDLYGYDIFLVTLNQGNHSIPYDLNPNVKCKDLGIQFHQQYKYRGLKRLYVRFQLKRLFKTRLQKLINAVKPDAIVCVRLELMKTISQVKGNIPLVYESHNCKNAHHFLKSNLLERIKFTCLNRHAKKAQLIVALTEGDALDWQSVNPHVCVIPNVVSLNRSGRFCDTQAKSVIFVGRFSIQKDILSLIRIWSIVHLRHPDWQLNIFGGYGELMDELLPLVKQVNANISVSEPTSKIFEAYLKNSILLLTSVYEPFGLVLPEAMSCGLPVVAFDCPYGPSEIITDGIDGFLIKNRDIEMFANKVCLLIENDELRMKMGQAGILSSKRYEASRIMPQWSELFERLSMT